MPDYYKFDETLRNGGFSAQADLLSFANFDL
jgi:hypothetical protein